MVMRSAFKRLINFAKCRQGAFGVVAAVMLPPTILTVGFGADYVYYYTEMTRARQAADAAALAGAKAGLEALNARMSNVQKRVNTVVRGTVTANRDSDQKSFRLALGNSVVPKAVFHRRSGGASVEVTLSYPIPSMFGKLVGVKTYMVNVRAAAFAKNPSYYDLVLVLDNSGSMLIGASPEDISNTRKAVSEIYAEDTPKDPNLTADTVCAFACHTIGTYDRIKQKYPGTQFRIDEIRQAADQLLATLDSYQSSRQLTFRVSVFALSRTTTPLIERATIADARAVIKTQYQPASTEAGTNYKNAFATLADYMKSAPIGDGTTATAPKQIILLATDGVEDAGNHIYSGSNGSYTAPPGFPTQRPAGAWNVGAAGRYWDTNLDRAVNYYGFGDPDFVEQPADQFAGYPSGLKFIWPDGGRNDPSQKRTVMQPISSDYCTQVKQIDSANIIMATLLTEYYTDPAAFDERFAWVASMQPPDGSMGVLATEMQNCASSEDLAARVGSQQDSQIGSKLLTLVQTAIPSVTMTQ